MVPHKQSDAVRLSLCRRHKKTNFRRYIYSGMVPHKQSDAFAIHFVADIKKPQLSEVYLLMNWYRVNSRTLFAIHFIADIKKPTFVGLFIHEMVPRKQSDAVRLSLCRRHKKTNFRWFDYS